jgi:hypothetical protein
MKKIGLAAMAVLVFAACSTKDDYATIFHDPAIYARTVYQLNEVVKGNNFPPVIASRNYAYAAIAGYEVMAAGDSAHYQSLAGQLHGLKPLPKPKGDSAKFIDYDFAALLAYIKVGEAVTFPEGSLKEYTDSLKKLALDHGMSEETEIASDTFAQRVGRAILGWSKKDNYLQLRSAPKYQVLDSPGRWQPTPPMYAQALEPHWNQMRTMALDSASEFMAPAPYKFNVKDTSSDYYKQVKAIETTGDSLTDEQKHIADFWDDNPFKLNVSGHVMFSTKKFSPPGHWMGIVGIAAKDAKADYNTTVYAYALTSIALFDAFIQCWDIKYTYNTVRPETVIDKYFNPDWRPYLQTPPFPEYTCGHSTGSSACAEALTKVFGDNFHYTDTTELEFGIGNLSFNSFREAALQNTWARFYGGIHYHNSCIASNHFGKEVGDLVADRLKMKK